MPWERQEDESPKSWEAFRAYRDMGPGRRSLRKLPELIGRVPNYKPVLDRWSVKYKWQDRVRAWDDYQDKVGRDAALKELEEMKKRHIQQAVGLQTKALMRLQKLSPDELSAGNVLGFISEAIKIERMARGEPDQILEERRRLSDDEAKQVSKLATDPEFMGALQRAIDEAEKCDPADGSPGQMAAKQHRGSDVAKAKRNSPGSSA